MFSKIAVESRRPRSLAFRLTAWYVGSAFLSILAVTAFLYWALVRGLDREDDEMLADKARIVLASLHAEADNPAEMRRELHEADRVFQHSPMWVRVLGADGRPIDETPEMTDTLKADLFPAANETIGGGVDLRRTDGKTYRLMAVLDPPTGLTIQLGLDRSQDIELLEQYRGSIAVALIVGLPLCALAGYGIARNGLRPLRRMTETIARIGSHNLDVRIDRSGLSAELLVQADAFDGMLDRLGRSFDRLRTFSADIAHELRTPVNNLRGEIEVALGRDRPAVDYRDVLASGLEECERLGRLVESLLLIARAENPRTQNPTETFDAATESRAVVDFYEAAATEAGVSLEVLSEGGVRLTANRPLFQRVIGNLIANALAHTPPGGGVRISATRSHSGPVVCVEDTGSGIAPEHLPHVFDRFYRADAVRSSSDGNVGLGLAIVRSIVELHGGSATLQSRPGRGTRVTLAFPNPEPPNMTES